MKKGFTIVEVLIATSIMLMLGTGFVSMLGALTRLTKSLDSNIDKLVCKNNLAMISSALNRYSEQDETVTVYELQDLLDRYTVDREVAVSTFLSNPFQGLGSIGWSDIFSDWLDYTVDRLQSASNPPIITNVQSLIDAEYLKTVPTCPKGGNYSIEIRDSEEDNDRLQYTIKCDYGEDWERERALDKRHNEAIELIIIA